VTSVTDEDAKTTWEAAHWHGKLMVDCDGEKIGRLQDAYVDVETDERKFATVKEGFFDRHLTFVPLAGIRVGPDDLQVPAAKDLVRSAPERDLHGEELSQADESALSHHVQQNYTAVDTESCQRPARR
jgi:uncharacterized protein YrrD